MAKKKPKLPKIDKDALFSPIIAVKNTIPTKLKEQYIYTLFSGDDKTKEIKNDLAALLEFNYFILMARSDKHPGVLFLEQFIQCTNYKIEDVFDCAFFPDEKKGGAMEYFRVFKNLFIEKDVDVMLFEKKSISYQEYYDILQKWYARTL